MRKTLLSKFLRILIPVLLIIFILQGGISYYYFSKNINQAMSFLETEAQNAAQEITGISDSFRQKNTAAFSQNLNEQKTLLENSLAEKIDAILASLSQIAPDAIVSDETEKLEKYVSIIPACATEINAVVFYDADGQALTPEHIPVEGEISKTREITVSGIPFGKLTFFYTLAGIKTKFLAAKEKNDTLSQHNTKTMYDQFLALRKKNQASNEKVSALLFTVKQSLGYVSCISAVISCLIIFFIMINLIRRLIAEPAAEAIHLAGAIAEGNTTQRISHISDDEIGILCTSLNKMADEIDEKAKVIEGIAQGDLSSEVKFSSDEDTLAKNLSETLENFNLLIAEIKNNLLILVNYSQEIAVSSTRLAESSTEQASSIEEVTASMGEIASHVQQTAQSTADSYSIAENSLELTHASEENMHQLQDAMNEIRDAGSRISEITRTITSISFQTNLLALNAAVEAARAGENGAGFAVVAAEVRNLSIRSSEASKKTDELITESNEKIEAALELTERTAQSLLAMTGSIQKLTGIIEEISKSSRIQYSEIQQIHATITELNDTIQKNTASAEEFNAAGAELTGLSGTLQTLIEKFKIRIK